MKNLHFKYIAAKNFMCFGPKGIEIDLTKHKNIVLIKGYNLDRHRDEGDDLEESGEKKIASNGSGKSSVPEIMVYTLFGKTAKNHKKINHNKIINNKRKKGLVTEVRWGNYRVIRTRKPDSLRIWETSDGDWSKLGDEEWEKDHEISKGGIPATQTLVEEKLGFNYETFLSIVVFTDNNAGSFLELDAAKKREIVENLLSLDKFREYFEFAKKEKNNIKNNIKIQLDRYEFIVKSVETAKQNVENLQQKETQWKSNKQTELSRHEASLATKKTELEKHDNAAAIQKYTQAQELIESHNKRIAELIENDSKVKQIVTKIRAELENTTTLAEESKNEANSLSKQILIKETQCSVIKDLVNSLNSLKSKPICPTCYGPVLEENYINVLTDSQHKCKTYEAEIQTIEASKQEWSSKYHQANSKIKSLREAIKMAEEKSHLFSKQSIEMREKISELSKVSKPDVTAAEQLILHQIEQISKQINLLKQEIASDTPFTDLIATAIQEVATKTTESNIQKQNIAELEAELPYYEFYVQAFSEEGIRRFVIDGVLSPLNSRIAYWLQFLMDGKIKLQFNNAFEETIESNPSDGDPFVYHAMSGGERRMLNLSVSQAFAYIMMLNSGMCPSCVFLDEVTSNIDQIGVQGSYNMIMELAREKQVFITTHDQDLLEMLTGCDTIELQKKGGYTTLIS